MKLSVESLETSGAFSGDLIKRQITYSGKDDQEYTADVYLRRLSYLEVMQDFSSEDQVQILTDRICECVVDESGNRVFQRHDVTGVYDDGKPVLDKSGKPRGGLPPQVATSLALLIAEVNGLGKIKGDDSA